MSTQPTSPLVSRGFYWQPKETYAHELEQIAATGADTVYIPHAALDARLLDAARAKGIRVLLDWRIFAGDDARRRFPDSIPIDDQAAPFERDEWYIPACPSHPQLRAYRLQSIEDALDQHGDAIDGVWLDFIRFPVRWERAQPHMRALCFCAHCLQSFLQTEQPAFTAAEIRAHAQTILHERKAEWVAWKCASIEDFVGQVRRAIDARGLRLTLGIFSLPWTRAAFDGAIRTIAGQDLGNLAPHIDCFSPMVYHLLCHQSPGWIREVTDDVAMWTEKPVLPIIQAVDAPSTLSAMELQTALEQGLAARSTGVMIFTFAPLLDSVEKTAVVSAIFRAHDR